MRGAITHPLLLGRALPILLILCGAAGQTIVVLALLIPPHLIPLVNSTSLVSSVGRGGTPLGIYARRRRRMISQGVCIRPHLAADFFMRYFVSLIFLKCSVNILFWANFRPEPPSLTPLISLSSLLLSCLSILFLFFFARLLSSLPPLYGYYTLSEEDDVRLSATAEGGPLVPPVPFVPLL